MVSGPARDAARRWDDVHVNVAVVLARESDLRAVGREVRACLDAYARGQAARLAALARDDPEVAGVDEGDLRAAQSGAAQQQRLRALSVGCGRGEENEQEAQECSRHGSAFLSGD